MQNVEKNTDSELFKKEHEILNNYGNYIDALIEAKPLYKELENLLAVEKSLEYLEKKVP